MHALLAVLLQLLLYSASSEPSPYHEDGLNHFHTPAGRHRTVTPSPGVQTHLDIGAQCGGQGVACDLYSCVDGPFPGASCIAGSSCQRQSRWLHQCVADDGDSSQQLPPSTRRSVLPFRSTSASCKQVRSSMAAFSTPSERVFCCQLRHTDAKRISNQYAAVPVWQLPIAAFLPDGR
jgi:hypothetical protein